LKREEMNSKSLFLSFCALIICTSATTTETSALSFGAAATKASSNMDIVILYIIALALCGVGVLFTLFGLKMFKAIIFIVGFCMVFAPIFVIAIAPQLAQDSPKVVDLLLAFIVAVIFGIGGGYLALCCHKFAVFMVGFACGFAAFLLAGLYFLGETKGNEGTVFLIAFIGGVIGGILAIWIHDVMIIIQTSMLGSSMIVLAINMFKNGFDFMAGMYDDSILFALIGIIITVGGVIFQYKNRTNEKEMQKQSMISQDPMVVHVGVMQPQVVYQQPYGAPVYQQPYGAPVYQPVQGYQQQPQQPASGYAQMHPTSANDSSSADYHQVNN
jgi:hypothetical protein